MDAHTWFLWNSEGTLRGSALSRAFSTTDVGSSGCGPLRGLIFSSFLLQGLGNKNPF